MPRGERGRDGSDGWPGERVRWSGARPACARSTVAALALVASACGATTPPTRVEADDAPRAPGQATRRGRLLDVRGEVLAAGDRPREILAPTSLAPWIGGVSEVCGTMVGGGGLEERFDEHLLRGEDVQVSLDAALHRRLEAAAGDRPGSAVAVIDLESHGIRALFATGAPAGAVPGAHGATAASASPGFTVAPFAALALLAGEPPSAPEPVALALRRSDESEMSRLAGDLDPEHLARAQIAFGLGNGTGLWHDEPRGARPRQPRVAAGATSPTAERAIGRDLTWSPLHVARAYAALATGELAPLSLRADGRPTFDRHLEDAWSRAAPDLARGLATYAPHLDVVRTALGGALADRSGGALADLSGTCGTSTGERDGADVTVTWCAGYGGHPGVAFAVMAEGTARDRVLGVARAIGDAR